MAVISNRGNMDYHLQRYVSPALKSHLKKCLVLGALFWIMAYLLIIKRGYQDHTNAMPAFASLCNFAWEITFAFIYKPPAITQRRINLFWCCLDTLIILQFILYGHAYFLPEVSVVLFYLVSIVLFIICLFSIILISRASHDTVIGRYTAFGVNVIISASFIMMLLQKGVLGQSMYIAFAKFMGTGIISYAFMKGLPKDYWVHLMAVSCIILDIIYIVMLYQAFLLSGIQPWQIF